MWIGLDLAGTQQRLVSARYGIVAFALPNGGCVVHRVVPALDVSRRAGEAINASG
jgi:hypothetical protein